MHPFHERGDASGVATTDGGTAAGFRFAYEPGTVVYGEGRVSDLERELAAIGAERGLVVAGETVGTTDAVVGPVREGLGDRLADVFAGTTPEKRLAQAAAAADAYADADADAFVALGGGSSLDVAKVASAMVASGQPYEGALNDLERAGTVPVPAGELPPIVAVPTTLAGADLSVVAGITARRDDGPVVRGGVFDGRLMPAALVYDPDLFRTTPDGVLCASAMNGFDKGLETVYARNGTPVTDGTALRGLRLLARGLPALGAGDRDADTMHDAIVGTILVQYGASRGDGTTLSVIHAFGHGLARGYDLQQGAAHGVIAPHAVRDIFDAVDGRREELAEALGVAGGDDGPETTAAAVVDAIDGIRESLGLPGRLRETAIPREDLPDIARAVVDDGFMPNRPRGYDPTAEDIEAVLERAW
ncbi:iron-containing alcohol dehydrogenase family protein [Haloglomus halophilum]|uniref:iron-containing alcohol dehydrogenase family protein n=1 Tax=Haloglomus halophilum TaxID=2962672 RepID=UPI0020C988BA|nr:iron-containing alcohol dehydrogenase family protein [Haloglomus halophilum]